MQIRKAIAADLDPIMDLVGRVVPRMHALGNFQWSDTYPTRDSFQRDLSLNQLWCIEIEGSVAAVAAITGDQSPEYADAGWDLSEPAIVVHRLAVDPAHRGLGLARALMLHAEAIARERGILRMRTDTNSQNMPMQKLFTELGYTFAGEISLSGRVGLRFHCYGKTL